MNKLFDTKMIYPMIAVILVIALFLLYKKQARQVKVSEFGKYQGYSKEIYNGNKRISDYLTLSNGTRLAYNLIVPTKRGVPASEALPVLFKYTPYLRTFTIFDKNGKNIIADLVGLGWKEKAYLRIRYWFSDRGRLMGPLFRTRWLGNMVKHGYAVIVVERPGTGASFGTFDAQLGLVQEFLRCHLCAQGYGWPPMGMRIDDFHQNFSPAFSGKYFLKKDRKNLTNSGEVVNKN